MMPPNGGEQIRRLLIVSPHFPPSNTADSQRVRMLLPFFRENGWQPTVLAVRPEQVAAPLDPWLEEGLPEDVEVIRVKARGLGWSRIPGLGTLDYRALGPLRREGNRLLRDRHFDLIYFSTTVFGVHVLGPYWKQKFGALFVMDYQDPWVSDYYEQHPEFTPPGGRIKFAVMQRLARCQEPKVLSFCAGITSVSPDYPLKLRQRYPAIPNYASLVLPFPGSSRDIKRARATYRADQPINTEKKEFKWIYVGRGGEDMQTAVSAVFHAYSLWCKADPFRPQEVKMHFIGTSYAPAGSGSPSILPIADRYGLSDRVVEQTDRVTYSNMLRLLKTADALIVLGSNDPAYTASKIYPYLLARRPLLCVFHKNSSIVKLMRKVGGGVMVDFGGDESIKVIGARIYDKWIASVAYKELVDLDDDGFENYLDRTSAKKLSEFFDKLIINMKSDAG